MGLLSFICWLLTAARPARRQAADDTEHELMHGQFSKNFFDADSPLCELRLARSKIAKNRRR
jgi:hypothetical protein